MRLIAFDQEQSYRPKAFFPAILNPHRFSKILLLQGIDKSDLWTPVWGPKTLAKTGLATEGLPSSRTCVDMPAALPMETQRYGKRPVPAETIETLAIFRLVTKILGTKTASVFGAQKRTQNGGYLFSLCQICLCPHDLASVFWGPFLDTKNGGPKFLPRAKNAASFFPRVRTPSALVVRARSL